MHSTSFTYLALAALVATSSTISATRLYVSSHTGITTLELSKLGNPSYSNAPYSNASYSLARLDTNNDCTAYPEWLQIDVKHQNLFCLGQGYSDDAHLHEGSGTLTSFKIKDKTLVPVSHTVIPSTPVHSALFTSSDGIQLLAVAHDSSRLTTWKIDPSSANYQGIQNINFTLDKPGPVANGQATSHPQRVGVDPRNEYLVVPDLGADLIRILYIDPKTLLLTPCPPIDVKPGSGPRHGVFYTSADKTTVHYYLVNKLSSTLSRYIVRYLPNNGGMQMDSFGEESLLGVGNFPSEIVVAPPLPNSDIQYLVSISNATIPYQSLSKPSDVLVSFTWFANNATSKDYSLSPAGRTFPRHFSPNKKGNLVAVGAMDDQEKVVIFKRSINTGKVEDKPVAHIEGLGRVTRIVWDDGEEEVLKTSTASAVPVASANSYLSRRVPG
ncbi:MAG: hypothetical protein Q9210_004071 [Variospora velana]